MAVAATAKASAAQPGASTQPGSTQSHKMLLTKQSAKIGEFKEHGIICNLSKLGTVDDCKSWCDSWAEAAPPVKCISEAIAVLQEPNSRRRNAELHRMCKFWDVQQKPAQKKRKLSEIKAELE